MTRHAVEQHTTPAPKIDDPNSDQHPYNVGLIIADVGSLVVFMSTANPGRFWLDLGQTIPASDQQAKAAFGVADFNRYRAQAVELADDRRIEQVLASAQEPAPEVTELEQKKALARKLIREEQRKVQAAADRAVTADLGLDTQLPSG
jgi:hypothetical protein